MLIEKGDLTYKDIGYDRKLSKGFENISTPIYDGDNAGGDLTGLYPRPSVDWANGNTLNDARYLKIGEEAEIEIYTQATEPDVTANKLAIWVDSVGGNIYLIFKGNQQVMVELTTGLVASPSESPSESPSLSPSSSVSPSE